MSDYPNRLDNIFYGLQKQEPSYRSDFPSDLPFDPGTTSSIFELNYFPTTGSWLLLLVPLVLVLLLVLFRKYIRRDVGALGFIVVMAIVFFGPLRLPSFFIFNTSLGLVKGIGLMLLAYVGISQLFRKIPFDVFRMQSFLPIGSYILSLLLSVFVMTNPEFFLQDFGMIIIGLIFYYLGFTLFSWKHGYTLLSTWSRLLLIPSTFVLITFVSRSYGSELMSFLFQRYENFVFLHDIGRGRIFSIIDFEYFIPCLALLLFERTFKQGKSNPLQFYFITALSFAAILLVNYRYRFLTYIVGFAFMFLFTKQYASVIRRATMSVLVILGVAYFALSFIFNRSTIVDRFLLRNYSEDAVSVERRLVMYGQAWDLFTQTPLLGVGLGNYKDNVQIVYSRFGGRTYEPYYKILQNVYAYPHNWFLTVLAENGIVGFSVLMWLLYTFITIDIRLYKRLIDEKLLIFVTIAAIGWLYVFANFFTMMHVSLPMVIVFWACRGMIERIYLVTFPEKVSK